MAVATYFLPPVASDTDAPTFADAFGFSDLFNFSHTPSDLLAATDAATIASQGTTLVAAEATASGTGGPFADLLTTTDNAGVVIDGAGTVKADSRAEVFASFNVAAGETFAFDFDLFSDMTAKEIENPDREYSDASLATGFIILETSDPSQPTLLGQVGSFGTLVSTDKTAGVAVDHHVADQNGRFEIVQEIEVDIDGDNQVDGVSGVAAGFFEQQFEVDSQITVIQFNNNTLTVMADKLIGQLGSDVTYGTIWDDTLTGGGKIYASMGDDRVYGRRGEDILEGGHGNDTLKGYSGDDSLHGGLGDDSLDGGSGNDVLMGGDGDDKLRGRRGSDRLEGGDGDDTLSGGCGRDTLEGGDGDDLLKGRRGNDSLDGGEGDDALRGGSGRDHLEGGSGFDTLIGGGGKDTLMGGEDGDLLIGDSGSKLFSFFGLLSCRSHDLLIGGAGDDTLQGGHGRDTMVGGLGDDEMHGGWGADQFLFVKGESLAPFEADVIGDFALGRDKVVFDGWGLLDEEAWLADMTASGNALDTAEGVALQFEDGASLSLLGVDLTLSSISASDFEFL